SSRAARPAWRCVARHRPAIRHRRVRPQDGAALHAPARDVADDPAQGHSPRRSLVPHLRGGGVTAAARARDPGAIAAVGLGLLLSLDLFVAYAFVAARGGPPGAALAYAVVFLAASVVPVYFVWLTPELFNVSLVFYALFLWCHKEVAGDRPVFTASFLRSARS